MSGEQRKESTTANGDVESRRPLLEVFVDKMVSVVTNDGRLIMGSLRGFDQVCNIILDKSVERVFSKDRGVQVVSLGLYVIRGDNIAVVGEIDAEKDAAIAWTDVKGHPMKRVVH